MDRWLLSDGCLEFVVDDDGELVVHLPLSRLHLLLLSLANPLLFSRLQLLLLLDFLLLASVPHLVKPGPILLVGDAESALRKNVPAVVPPDGDLLQVSPPLEVMPGLVLLHGNYK